MNIPELTGAIEKRDAAYEIKFVVPLGMAEKILPWARSHLSPDPHIPAQDGDGYGVNSLYFDTPSLDVYRRNGSYGKAKYRVRRYANESTIFLERKLKSRGLVSKRRVRIPDDDILLLATSTPMPEWVGHWFRRRLRARRLMPQCQIKYQRMARVGTAPEGPIRLTLDRDIRSFLTQEYRVLEQGDWFPILPDQCILELKFRSEMPPVFKTLTDALGLTAQAVSKYRLSVQAAGLAPKVAEPALAVTGNGHITPEEIVGSDRRRTAEVTLSNPSA